MEDAVLREESMLMPDACMVYVFRILYRPPPCMPRGMYELPGMCLQYIKTERKVFKIDVRIESRKRNGGHISSIAADVIHASMNFY